MESNTKRIKDVNGTEHEYSIALHPAEDAITMMPKIMNVISTVVGPLINTIGDNAKILKSDDTDWFDAKVDGDQVAGAINLIADAFITVGGVGFIKELLRHTTREHNGAHVKVANAPHFNEIYTGNYGELVDAVIFAFRFNFLPSLRAKLGNNDLMSRIDSLSQLKK